MSDIYSVWIVEWNEVLCSRIIDWKACALLGYGHRKSILKEMRFNGVVVNTKHILSTKTVDDTTKHIKHITNIIEFSTPVDRDFVMDYYSGVGIITPIIGMYNLEWIDIKNINNDEIFYK